MEIYIGLKQLLEEASQEEINEIEMWNLTEVLDEFDGTVIPYEPFNKLPQDAFSFLCEGECNSRRYNTVACRCIREQFRSQEHYREYINNYKEVFVDQLLQELLGEENATNET